MSFHTRIALEDLRLINAAIDQAEQYLSLARTMVGMKIDKIAEENLPRQDEVEIPRKKPRPKKEPEVK